MNTIDHAKLIRNLNTFKVYLKYIKLFKDFLEKFRQKLGALLKSFIKESVEIFLKIFELLVVEYR
jgi:hypothetical protein